MANLPDEICDYPMLVALLQILDRQRHRLRPSKSTSEENGNPRVRPGL
jgi:hypothetical protein